MNSDQVILKAESLRISFGQSTTNYALKDLSFELSAGEILGVVGESGSGKSLMSLAIMGLLPPGATIGAESRIKFGTSDEVDLLKLTESEKRAYRGKLIPMIFQEPMTSLNPVMTCGEQVAESMKHHLHYSKTEAKARVIDLFREVDLPRVEEMYDAFPHQLSGGQKQRVMIAMAMACDPVLIIADEPTTALDVTVQRTVLDLLKKLCKSRGVGMIFITHDLGVVAEIADRVLVLYRGEVQEIGKVEQVLRRPAKPYTKALLACRPKLDSHPYRLPVISDFIGITADQKVGVIPLVHQRSEENLLEVSDLKIWYPQSRDLFGRTKSYLHAVDGISFSIKKGETIGLVGESGCGKSTIGRAIVKLVPLYSGSIRFKSQEIGELSNADFFPFRKSIQLIFQDPYASLNPRFTFKDTLDEVLHFHLPKLSRQDRMPRISAIIDKVGLPQTALRKYPHEFSGGQRQRISIARALIMEPEFIICDESVSALDVSVQAQVLNLLNDLKDQFGLTYLFISHDLSVVKYMSDRLIVMRKGKIEEMGDSETVYRQPQSVYTERLIAAIPQVR